MKLHTLARAALLLLLMLLPAPAALAALQAQAGQPFAGTVGTSAEGCPIDPDTASPGHPAERNCQLLGSAALTGTIVWGDGGSSPATVERSCPQTLGSPSCTIRVSGQHTYATGGTYNGSFTWSDPDPTYPGSGGGSFTMLVSGGARPCAGTTPVAVTGAASSVGSTTANVAGTVNPCGTSTTAHFAYATAIDYARSGYTLTTAPQSVGAGTSPQPVSAALSGLTAGTTYHYRVEATPAGGAPTPPGSDATFTTTGASPFALSPESVGATQHTPFTAVVAHIADGGANLSAGSFNATVDWGDGSPAAAGTVTATGAGTWDISGSHTYPAAFTAKTYTVTVSVTKGGVTHTVTETASVAGPPPKPGPPIAQFTSLGDPFSYQERFPVTFDASASYSPCNAADQQCDPAHYLLYKYHWTVDGQPVDCYFDPKLTVIFPVSERAHVSLQVSDSASPNQTSPVVEHDVDIHSSGQGYATPRPLYTSCGDGKDIHVVNVRTTGIEVNQAVQTASPTQPAASWQMVGPSAARYTGVPLAGGHDTIVRVFGDVPGYNGTLDGLTAELHGYDAAGHEFADSPLLPVGGPHSISDQHSSALTWSAVSSSTEPFAFRLPPEWTHGSISLAAQVVPPASALDVSCVSCHLFTLSGLRFQELPAMHVIPIELDYRGNSETKDGPWWAHGGPPAVEDVFKLARRVMPMQLDITPYAGKLDLTTLLDSKPIDPKTTKNNNDLRQQDHVAKSRAAAAQLHQWLDDNGITSSSSPVVGVSDYITDYSGSNDIGLYNGYGDPNTAVVNWQRPIDSVAHELGHATGRPHASPCGDGGKASNGGSEDWPPDEEGALQGVGLDTQSLQLYADPSPKGHYDDLMSYCAGQGQWVSARGWGEEFHWHPATDRPAADRGATTAAGGPVLLVSASASAAGVSIDGVAPVPRAGRATGTTGTFTLLVRDRHGRTRSTVPMHATFGHADGAGPIAFLTAYIREAGAASVSVAQSGRVLATRTRTAHAPQIRLLGGRRVITTHHGQSTIRFTERDADGDPLQTQVEYSVASHARWSTIFLGDARGRVVLPNRLLSASRSARLRLTVDDGFNHTTVLSQPFVAPGAPPAAGIIQPGRGTVSAADATLVLAGAATDDRGRPLAGRALRWSSGGHVLGTGTTTTVSGLAPGRHVILLRATDRRRRVGQAAVVVHITRAVPHLLTLTAPGALSARTNRLRLRVRSSLPATLAVGRQRFRVSRTTSTVTLTVARSHAPLVLALRLTAWGQSSGQSLILRRS